MTKKCCNKPTVVYEIQNSKRIGTLYEKKNGLKGGFCSSSYFSSLLHRPQSATERHFSFTNRRYLEDFG